MTSLLEIFTLNIIRLACLGLLTVMSYSLDILMGYCIHCALNRGSNMRAHIFFNIEFIKLVEEKRSELSLGF